MYQYKINNSYSVHVNPGYYMEAKSICDLQRSSMRGNHNNVVCPYTRKKIHAAPIANGTTVTSKAYGCGVVVDTDPTGIMRVQFDGRVVCFLYPDAIRKGHLYIPQH